MKALAWMKEHAAISLSLAVNAGLTAAVVWQAHTIQAQRVLIYKMWFLLQLLTHGQAQ